nr:uncharacterized protein LOC111511669 [Leptinotarsa decemlineata]
MIPSIICVISILAQTLLVNSQCLENYKECLEMNNLTIDDLKPYKYGDKLPEPQLCATKCAAKKLGALEPDGTIHFVKIENHPEFIKFYNSDTKKCLSKLPKIVECVDMQVALDCFADIGLSMDVC